MHSPHPLQNVGITEIQRELAQLRKDNEDLKNETKRLPMSPRTQILEKEIKRQEYEIQLLKHDLIAKDQHIKHCADVAQACDLYSDMKANETEDIKRTSESLATRLQQTLDSLHHTRLMRGQLHQVAETEARSVLVHREAAQEEERIRAEKTVEHEQAEPQLTRAM